MAAPAAVRRERYARWQPVFWRPTADAQDKHRTYFSGLVARGEVIALVSEHASPSRHSTRTTWIRPGRAYSPSSGWQAAGAALAAGPVSGTCAGARPRRRFPQG
jgi:hypothetical protein